MEAKKLEAKIEDWAASLGFTLPNNIAPPPHYFSSLTATPHRRQLWQVIVESIQDRKKIEYIRKQLYVYSVKQEKKNRNDVSDKKFSSRVHLSAEQKALKNKIVDKKKEIDNLERKILTGASDLIFDDWKVTEIQKQSNEFRKKALAIRLMSNKQNIFTEQLDKYLASDYLCGKADTSQPNFEESSAEDILINFDDKTFLSEKCKNQIYHECFYQKIIEKHCKSGGKVESLWTNAVQEKKKLLEKFLYFLKDIPEDSCEFLGEKDGKKIEQDLKISLEKLKQEICLKSLQAMINDSETNCLEWENKKLMEKIENIYMNSSCNSSSGNPSYLLDGKIGGSFEGNSHSLIDFKNNLTRSGLQKYKEFLKHEISKLDNEILGEQEYLKKITNEEEEFRKSLSEIKSISGEIEARIAEQEEQKNIIRLLLEKAGTLMKESESLVKDENFISQVQETICNLKTYSEKQLEEFLKIPLDAIATDQDFSGRSEKSLPSELTTNRFNESCGGEFKQILKSLLIHPNQTTEFIFKEIERRKTMVNELENFLAKKKKLSESFKEALTRVSFLKYETNSWEKNYDDCQKVLSNILRKAKGLPEEIEFMKKILHNWYVQPYKSMIDASETVDGMTLKDYEGLYEKNKHKSQMNLKKK